MSDGSTQYGFVWGPMEVLRAAIFREGDKDETRAIQIKTEHRTLDVYVSRTGRSVRVFEKGRELK
jgi:hypothetical protein